MTNVQTYDVMCLTDSPSRTVTRLLSSRQLRDGNGLQDARRVNVLQRRLGGPEQSGCPSTERSVGVNAAVDLRYAELLDERTLHEALLQRAHQQRKYWMTRSIEETQYWSNRIKDLEFEIRGTNARMRAVLSAEDRARHADRQEEFGGASNGAIDWESR